MNKHVWFIFFYAFVYFSGSVVASHQSFDGDSPYAAALSYAKSQRSHVVNDMQEWGDLHGSDDEELQSPLQVIQKKDPKQAEKIVAQSVGHLRRFDAICAGLEAVVHAKTAPRMSPNEYKAKVDSLMTVYQVFVDRVCTKAAE